MDRLAPRERPDQLALGLETWRDQVILHWAVPVREVRRLLPDGLEPDLYRGVAYVGVSILEASRARPAFVPLKVGLRFHQVTVRTYVHAAGENPGLYVLSLDSSSPLIARLVRSLVNVPAYSALVTCDSQSHDRFVDLVRGGAEPADLHVRWRPTRALGELTPGSLGFFLLERYMLYFESGTRLFRLRVHHPPYQARNARVSRMSGTLVEAAGVAAPNHLPRHSYFVEQVDLEVFPPELVERTVPVEDTEPDPLWSTARLTVAGGAGAT